LTFTVMRRRHNSELFNSSNTAHAKMEEEESNTAHAKMENESRAMPSKRASRQGRHKLPGEEAREEVQAVQLEIELQEDGREACPAKPGSSKLGKKKYEHMTNMYDL